MENLKKIVGENLAELRKNKGLTQLELAEKFNYSDRAISKWENGDTLPDLDTLYNLCEYYGVTLDYLTHKENKDRFIKIDDEKTSHDRYINNIIITCLIGSIVWMVATIVFVYTLLNPDIEGGYWLAYVWSVPICSFVIVLFNRAYFKWRILYFYLWSLFVWSLLAAIFLQLIVYSDTNAWPIFLLGIPMQISLVLWVSIRKPKIKKLHK